MAHATYDCLTCGACCAAPPEKRHLRIDAGDVERLRRVGLEVVQIPIPQVDPPVLTWALPTKLDANGVRVCVGLSGCSGAENACSVYEQRPDTCRRFIVGSFPCREARRRFGLPV